MVQFGANFSDKQGVNGGNFQQQIVNNYSKKAIRLYLKKMSKNLSCYSIF